MGSLVPGYNYDIFISYRQKDNKHDGWVTKFVNDLKGELETVFKEEISVYFDVNPHDGILETHDVDESLREKLKCLIFIPVVSKTYCDPKSFAWEHEFRAFIRKASDDQLGLKVMLTNGNVAGRVLPVQIHELDSADKSVIENELGGVLRSVEFVYKEPGVNRPLTAGDREEKNKCGTNYRNQINKVANAVAEILDSIVSKGQEPGVGKTADPENVNKDLKPGRRLSLRRLITRQRTGRSRKTILTFGSAVITGAILSLLIFTSGSSLPFKERDWIIVADFDNQTNDRVFDNTLYTAFTITSNQSRYVNIVPRSRMIETMRRMKLEGAFYVDEKIAREMAVREGITLAVIPSIANIGDNFILSARILNSGTGEYLKSEIVYAGTSADILPAIDILSRKIRRDLGESRFNIRMQDKPLKKVTTSSLDALKMYSLGIDSHLLMDFESARDFYGEALNIDTGFVAAKASLGNLLIERFNEAEGRLYLEDAMRNIDRLTDRERLGIQAFYAVSVLGDTEKGIELAEMRSHLYPDDAVARNNLGYYYALKGDYENALKEYKQAIRIDRYQAITYGGIIWTYLTRLGDVDSSFAWSEKMIKDNPGNAWGYFYLGSSWICTDSIDRAGEAFEKARELSPRLTINLYRLAHTYRISNRYADAINVLNVILKYNQDEFSAYYDLGINYTEMGDKAEGMKYFTKFRELAAAEWMRRYPDSPDTYISLSTVYARMGDMDMSEQMLSKALSLDTGNYRRLAEVYCVQGRIPEALKTLKKALDSGYRDLSWLRMSPEYQNLYYDTRYRDLLNKYFN